MRAALALAALAACSSASPKSRGPAGFEGRGEPAPPPSGVLSHIPAATPYLIANIRRPPAAVVERTTKKQLARLDRSLTLLGQILSKAENPEAMSAESRFMLAVARQLHGHLDGEGLREVGLDLGAPMAVFGLGAFPAVRLELADPSAFTAAFERVLETAKLPLAARELGGRRYWTVPIGTLLGVVAIDGDELSAALIPARARGQLMPLILGLERPPRSLAASDLVPSLIRRHRLAGYAVGYIDVHRAFEVVFGPGAVAVAGKRSPAALEILAPDAARQLPRRCLRQLASLADVVPRVVYGPRQAAANRERGTLFLELAAQITKRLDAHLTPIPGIDSALARDADLVVGLGVRPSALAGLATDAVDRVAALDGCDIPGLAPLRRQLDQLARSLAPVGGAGAAITRYEEDERGELRRLAGAFAVSVDDPQVLLSIFGLAGGPNGPSLPPPGRANYPRRLPPSDPTFDPIWLWLGDESIALSAGLEGAALEAFAASRSAAASDVAAVLHLRGALAEELDRDEPSPELVAIDPALANELADASRTGMSSVDVVARVAEDGVAFDFEITYRRDARAPRDRSPSPP